MKQELRIDTVYCFSNGMCVVFDQNGKQMPQYQGKTSECIDKIRAVYDGPIQGCSWTDHGVERIAEVPGIFVPVST